MISPLAARSLPRSRPGSPTWRPAGVYLAAAFAVAAGFWAVVAAAAVELYRLVT